MMCSMTAADTVRESVLMIITRHRQTVGLSSHLLINRVARHDDYHFAIFLKDSLAAKP